MSLPLVTGNTTIRSPDRNKIAQALHRNDGGLGNIMMNNPRQSPGINASPVHAQPQKIVEPASPAKQWSITYFRLLKEISQLEGGNNKNNSDNNSYISTSNKDSPIAAPPLEAIDSRYQKRISELHTQKQAESFERTVEREELMGEIHLLKRQMNLIATKIANLPPKSKLVGHYQAKADKLLRRQVAFKDYHGQQFSTMENEKVALEEYLTNFKVASNSDQDNHGDIQQQFDVLFGGEESISIVFEQPDTSTRTTATNHSPPNNPSQSSQNNNHQTPNKLHKIGGATRNSTNIQSIPGRKINLLNRQHHDQPTNIGEVDESSNEEEEEQDERHQGISLIANFLEDESISNPEIYQTPTKNRINIRSSNSSHKKNAAGIPHQYHLNSKHQQYQQHQQQYLSQVSEHVEEESQFNSQKISSNPSLSLPISSAAATAVAATAIRKELNAQQYHQQLYIDVFTTEPEILLNRHRALSIEGQSSNKKYATPLQQTEKQQQQLIHQASSSSGSNNSNYNQNNIHMNNSNNANNNNNMKKRSISLPKQPSIKPYNLGRSPILRGPSNSTSIEEEVPTEASVVDRDEEDLKAVKECVAKLDEMMKAIGGPCCGWSAEDHRSFMYLMKRYGRSGIDGEKVEEARRDRSVDALKFYQQKELVMHAMIVDQYEDMQQQKLKFIESYKEINARLNKKKVEAASAEKARRKERELSALKAKADQTEAMRKMLLGVQSERKAKEAAAAIGQQHQVQQFYHTPYVRGVKKPGEEFLEEIAAKRQSNNRSALDRLDGIEIGISVPQQKRFLNGLSPQIRREAVEMVVMPNINIERSNQLVMRPMQNSPPMDQKRIFQLRMKELQDLRSRSASKNLLIGNTPTRKKGMPTLSPGHSPQIRVQIPRFM